jgi:hypothetical protein
LLNVRPVRLAKNSLGSSQLTHFDEPKPDPARTFIVVLAEYGYALYNHPSTIAFT